MAVIIIYLAVFAGGIWCGATGRVSERVSPTDARTDFG